MQDIPRELPDNSNVGFTVINQVWLAVPSRTVTVYMPGWITTACMDKLT